MAPGEIPTAVLLPLAENMAGGVERWLAMTDEQRAGMGRGDVPVSESMLITIPIFISFVTELESRGIPTGWQWFLDIWNGATNG